MKITAKCLCERSEFEFTPKHKHFDACHCSMCRRWGGSPALTIESSEKPNFIKEDSIKVYDSSEWAQRAFCQECGSHLFYSLKNGALWSIPFGLVDSKTQSELEFSVQIYIDHKPSSYEFANKTKMMTEAEVIEAFSDNSSE